MNATVLTDAEAYRWMNRAGRMAYLAARRKGKSHEVAMSDGAAAHFKRQRKRRQRK